MSAMMKALVKRARREGHLDGTGAGAEPGPNEVLIKLEKTAICGTDLHIYKWDEWSQRTIKPGLVIGHEFVGRIVELGGGVTGYTDRRPGFRRRPYRLRPLPQLPRRAASICARNTVGIGVNRDGAFAEYIAMPASQSVADPGPDSVASWPRSSIPTATPRIARWSSTSSARTC